jgi:hypothetical protein
MEEEAQLADWFIKMTEAGHRLSPTALKMKVSEITMTRPTPFRNGVPGDGWMCG